MHLRKIIAHPIFQYIEYEIIEHCMIEHIRHFSTIYKYF